MEAMRRLDGRIAAQRCYEASLAATDERTREALERCAARYMLKARGVEWMIGEVGAPILATDIGTPKVLRGVHAAQVGNYV